MLLIFLKDFLASGRPGDVNGHSVCFAPTRTIKKNVNLKIACLDGSGNLKTMQVYSNPVFTFEKHLRKRNENHVILRVWESRSC
jgi:hypothetical protein